MQRAFGGFARRVVLPRQRSPRPRRPLAAAPAPDVIRLAAVLASYGGHLRHGAACIDWMHTWRRHGWLRYLFRLQAGRAVPRWRPGLVESSEPPARRYARLLQAAGDDVLVFLRVGRYIEFLGPQRLLAQRLLGLRAVQLARFGWGLTAGFPVWHAARFAERALGAGAGVVLLRAPRQAAFLLVPGRIGTPA